MKNNTFLKTYFEIVAVVLLFGLFVCNIFGQREIKPLANAETVINKKCATPSEVRAFSFVTTAHIFLLMEEEYFTKPHLIKLFTCVSRSYPKLISLQITASSDRKEFANEIEKVLYPPPSDPILQDTNPSPPPNCHRAYYDRFRKEYFEYSPDPTKWRMVTYNFRKPSVPLVK